MVSDGLKIQGALSWDAKERINRVLHGRVKPGRLEKDL
jgi:hypothetical protein